MGERRWWEAVMPLPSPGPGQRGHPRTPGTRPSSAAARQQHAPAPPCRRRASAPVSQCTRCTERGSGTVTSTPVAVLVAGYSASRRRYRVSCGVAARRARVGAERWAVSGLGAPPAGACAGSSTGSPPPLHPTPLLARHPDAPTLPPLYMSPSTNIRLHHQTSRKYTGALHSAPTLSPLCTSSSTSGCSHPPQALVTVSTQAPLPPTLSAEYMSSSTSGYRRKGGRKEREELRGRGGAAGGGAVWAHAALGRGMQACSCITSVCTPTPVSTPARASLLARYMHHHPATLSQTL